MTIFETSNTELERSNTEAPTELATVGGLEGCEVSGLSKTKGTCPMCSKLIGSDPNGYAFLNGGALFRHNKRMAAVHSKMEGFFIFGFHGAHDKGSSHPSAELSIADHAPYGQFELMFCSSACLRLFLNRCVDELEERLRRA